MRFIDPIHFYHKFIDNVLILMDDHIYTQSVVKLIIFYFIFMKIFYEFIPRGEYTILIFRNGVLCCITILIFSNGALILCILSIYEFIHRVEYTTLIFRNGVLCCILLQWFTSQHLQKTYSQKGHALQCNGYSVQ